MTRTRHPLFGGALQAFLPTGAFDASSVRIVPNHQEVFVHSDSDQSMIVEILERVSEVSDENAIKYHFDALAEANDAQHSSNQTINLIEQIPVSSFNIQRLSSAWYLSGQQKISKYHEQARNLVNIHLCLLRLNEDLSTDILISFNDPILVNSQSSSHEQSNSSCSRWSPENFREMVCSVEIVDYNLFLPNEDNAVEIN